MLNYQVHEFLEEVVGGFEQDELDAVRTIVIDLCKAQAPFTALADTSNTPTQPRAIDKQGSEIVVGKANAVTDRVINEVTTTTPSINHVAQVLSKSITYILAQPAVLSSPAEAQNSPQERAQNLPSRSRHRPCFFPAPSPPVLLPQQKSSHPRPPATAG
ncbi:hypothetical protein BDW71DRAFT_208917 [Aspergillus fruticulosus]